MRSTTLSERLRLYDQEQLADYTSEVIAGYDAVAEYYDTFYVENSDLAEDDMIFGRLKKLAIGRYVVDIGCGPGTVLTKGVCHSGNYTGIDLSLGMLAEAQKRHPEAYFINGDMSAAPSGSAQMLVGTFGPLCHIEDVPGFALQARRACAAGARMFLMSSRWPEVARITGAQMIGHTPWELQQSFARAGFSYVRVRGFVWKHGPMKGPRWLLRTVRKAETDWLGTRLVDQFKWLLVEGIALS